MCLLYKSNKHSVGKSWFYSAFMLNLLVFGKEAKNIVSRLNENLEIRIRKDNNTLNVYNNSNTVRKSTSNEDDNNTVFTKKMETLIQSVRVNDDSKSDFKNYTSTAFNSSLHIKSAHNEIDCFGLGSTFAATLQYFFKQQEHNASPLNTFFYIISRKMPHRNQVYLGDQFGLDWTDFDIRRYTVIIVHGFLSSGNEEWIHDMEKAFLLWVC